MSTSISAGCSRSLARRWKRIVFVALAGHRRWRWPSPGWRRRTTRPKRGILIETRESVFTRPARAAARATSPLLDEEGVTSQVEVIGSTDILKQVAQKLDLSRLPEFDEAADMSLLLAGS